MDSGAFSEISRFGGYRHSVEDYAAQIRRWRTCGLLHAAVSQDYMCEAFILDKTGLSIAEHQRLTIERYDALRACQPGAYVMPVLQGYQPADYASHVRQYGDRLEQGAWVGVGSVCKRNGQPGAIEAVLLEILAERPDLRLHGFGLKTTSLQNGYIRDCLWSADSMAWSYAARREGRNQNSYREAQAFARMIDRKPAQASLWTRLMAGEAA